MNDEDKKVIAEYDRKIMVKDFKTMAFLANKYGVVIKIKKEHEPIWNEVYNEGI